MVRTVKADGTLGDFCFYTSTITNFLLRHSSTATNYLEAFRSSLYIETMPYTAVENPDGIQQATLYRANRIGNHAFAGSNIRYISFYDDFEAQLKRPQIEEIGDYAFLNCKEFRGIFPGSHDRVVPKTVKRSVAACSKGAKNEQHDHRRQRGGDTRRNFRRMHFADPAHSRQIGQGGELRDQVRHYHHTLGKGAGIQPRCNGQHPHHRTGGVLHRGQRSPGGQVQAKPSPKPMRCTSTCRPRRCIYSPTLPDGLMSTSRA